MASKISTPNTSSPVPGRPAWIAPTFFVLALIFVVVVLTQLLGHEDKAPASSFSPTNAALGSILPLAAAAAIGALIPWKHGWRVRPNSPGACVARIACA